MGRHEDLTQKYSTWGDKLLQHTDVLNDIQFRRIIRPITIQIALCEVCDSDCAFCSVSGRPLRSYMPWHLVVSCLNSFSHLGAKSVELTGGGNPMLYRDKEAGKDINDVVDYASKLGLDVGIITNSHDFKVLLPRYYDRIKWIRVSLIKLDEGKQPHHYDFCGFPEDRIGFSYIIYDGVEKTPRLEHERVGTTVDTIRALAKMIELHPSAKFVRIAGNCLVKGNNAVVRDRWRPIIDELDKHGKFFIKDIGDDDGPFAHGCYVGMIRPYVAPSPHGGSYHVYACTSHVLNSRTYDLDYSLCEIEDVIPAWKAMNNLFRETGHPYSIKGNNGRNWCDTCKFCYYGPNNKVLHTVAHEMPDKNFA